VFSGSAIELATLTVTGAPAPTVAAISPRPAARDLRGSTVATRRTLILAMSMGMDTGMGSSGSGFTNDGRGFDPHRIDNTVEAGVVEEWTIFDDVSGVRPCGDNDDRKVAPSPDRSADGETVDAGQHYIEHDQIDVARVHRWRACSPVAASMMSNPTSARAKLSA
jgi:hypothetical protein